MEKRDSVADVKVFPYIKQTDITTVYTELIPSRKVFGRPPPFMTQVFHLRIYP